MKDQERSDVTNSPQINFDDIIKFQRRSSSIVERQVTVSRYRTYSTFDFAQIQSAMSKCRIKPSDNFGVIGVRTSTDGVGLDDPTQHPEHIQLDLGDQWVRALFAVIGNRNFRLLDFESDDIYEYLIEGVLDETFLVEYYRNEQNELRFLTYGGSRFSKKLNVKHRLGFGMHFGAIQEEFSPDFLRFTCSKPEFVNNLRSIAYAPEGEAGYGTVESASMKTKYQNVIDPGAKRVREILDNTKIVIREFGSKVAVYNPYVADSLSIRFDISLNGRVTLSLPEIKFPHPMTDIERENALYEIVRSAYALVTDKAVPHAHDVSQLRRFAPSNQMMLDFLKDFE